ncbi:MAG: UvrD-helicase domain-containing protein [Deltaproteobacteria bacterium]|nr:UvrD-helicase domain-containing protein [Deltaproteobacteria bacterium]
MNDTDPMDSFILEGLDAVQQRAVEASSRYILIVAPPGSGKTRVLSARFARLVKEGVNPDALLAVTFTNRAAKEMKERITALTGLSRRILDISTFHGFSLQLLKKTRPPFSLYGRYDTLRLLKELGVKSPSASARMVSAVKNGTIQAAGEDAEVCSAYAGALKRDNALDLDDLIPEAIKELEAGAAGGGLKSHIMVDEYQDINPLQARLVRLLAGGPASVVAIGDPDQAIYSFRGSSLKSFLEFQAEYPGAQIINLSRNYRSAGKIVFASGKLIENNLERLKKDSSPVRTGGEILYAECADERAESEFIIKEIERMMGGLTSQTAGDSELNFSNFAVLLRTNRQVETLAESFSRSSIPYYKTGEDGKSFGDFILHLKGRRPVGDVTLTDFIKEEGRLLGLKEDLVETFVRSASDYRERTAVEVLDEYFEEAALTEPEDRLDIKSDRVSLLTLHMAKGLEFKVVFIAGFEDGVVPYVKGGETSIEEERRLFYVGMTRARDTLYLVSAQRRRLWGEALESAPSRFLKELPDKLIDRVSIEKKRVKRRPVQKGLFD